MDYNINEDHLAILRYGKSNKLALDYEKIEEFFIYEKQEYKNLFHTNENMEYTLEDLKKLLNYFLNNISLNQLSMEYRYCQDLSGTFEGFTANIENTIKYIKSAIEIIETIISSNLSEEDTINKFMNYCQQTLLHEECLSLCLKNKLNDEIIQEITQRIINKVYNDLNLWIKAYSIQKTYRKCHDDNQILFFSHRIVGWASPVCQLERELSAEYKTNFGYGQASYFYVKLSYKNIELIPFSDLVKYRFAGYFEINQYTRKYELKNEEWKPAMEFLANAYNLLMESEERFIKKYMFDELERLVNGLSDLLEEEHFTFEDEKKGEEQTYLHYDSQTGEIIKNENPGIELTVLRAKKITNALDFINKIQEYQYLVEINTTINQIEKFNKSMKTIITNEVINTENEVGNIEKSIADIRPIFFDMRDKEMEYHRKKNIIQNDFNLYAINDIKKATNIKIYIDTSSNDIEEINKIINEELENIFLKQYPEYEEFKERYDDISNRFILLTTLLSSRKNILKELSLYKDRIIKYFSDNKN